MSLNWSTSCIKYLLFIFNLIFVITGIILLSFGVSIKAYYRQYEYFLDDNYISTPNLLISIGTIIFFIAFFGCCGALKENFCMIVTFSTFLILIFILEFAAGISGYVLRNKTTEYLGNRLESSLKLYNTNDTNAIIMWDKIQRNFDCCGVSSYKDWTTINKKLIPMSCCDFQNGDMGNSSCTPDSPTLHQEGCLDSFGDFIKDNAVTIGSVGLGLAFIQLLGIIFSCHLSRQIKKNYETV